MKDLWLDEIMEKICDARRSMAKQAEQSTRVHLQLQVQKFQSQTLKYLLLEHNIAIPSQISDLIKDLDDIKVDNEELDETAA